MSRNLAEVQDFLEDDGGFTTPPMPSTKHPEGHTYRVPSPDAITGLRLTALADLSMKYKNKQGVTEADVASLRLSDDDERDFIQQVLSLEVVGEMKDDGCRWEHMRRIGMYAYLFFTAGEKAAEDARENGLLLGKAPGPTPNRAQRRSKTPAKASATSGASPASSKTKAAKKA